MNTKAHVRKLLEDGRPSAIVYAFLKKWDWIDDFEDEFMQFFYEAVDDNSHETARVLLYQHFQRMHESFSRMAERAVEENDFPAEIEKFMAMAQECGEVVKALAAQL